MDGHKESAESHTYGVVDFSPWDAKDYHKTGRTKACAPDSFRAADRDSGAAKWSTSAVKIGNCFAK